MANGAYGGYGAGCNGSCNGFFVETPEVFQRATTAPNNQNIGHTVGLGQFNCTDNFCRCRLALHGCGVECDWYRGTTPRQNGENVVYGGTGRGGDNTNVDRQGWNRLFAAHLEQTF